MSFNGRTHDCNRSRIVFDYDFSPLANTSEERSESQARKAALSWLFSMNAEASSGTTVSFGAVIHRYLAEETPERLSTASRYRCWLKNYVEPKWRDYPIGQIKPLLVEDWLKKLSLAPKSESHLKNLMRVLFNAAMRWELIPYQHNPMSLVRVKDGSKRKTEGTEGSFCIGKCLRSFPNTL